MDRSDICHCADDILDLATKAAEAYSAATDKTIVPLVQQREDQATARVGAFLVALPPEDTAEARGELEAILCARLIGSRKGAAMVIKAAIDQIELSRYLEGFTLRKPERHGLRLH